MPLRGVPSLGLGYRGLLPTVLGWQSIVAVLIMRSRGLASDVLELFTDFVLTTEVDMVSSILLLI